MTISRILQGIGESLFSIPFGIMRDKFEPEKLAVPQGIFVSMFSVECSSRISHTPAPSKPDKFSHRGLSIFRRSRNHDSACWNSGSILDFYYIRSAVAEKSRALSNEHPRPELLAYSNLIGFPIKLVPRHLAHYLIVVASILILHFQY